MNRFSRRAGAAIFFGLCLALSAGAQDRKPIEKQPADKEPANEQEFLTHALDGNIHEVKMGELALKQTKNEEVRKFAQRMIDDHSKARDMLQNVAREMKIAVVEGTSPTKRERMDQLGKLE